MAYYLPAYMQQHHAHNQQHQHQPQGTVWHAGGPRIFNVYWSTFHNNYEVTTEDKMPVFYGKTSSFSRTMLTLHGGGDKHGPVLGVANRPMLSSSLKLGLGDPEKAGNMMWEDMNKQGFGHITYAWSTVIYRNGPGSHGESRTFLWKRTHSVGVGNSSPGLFSQNYKLVDARTNEVVGVFAGSGASINKRGKFQINKNYGPNFDIMVVLSGLGLVEKVRRTRNAGAAGAGGAAGGGAC